MKLLITYKALINTCFFVLKKLWIICFFLLTDSVDNYCISSFMRLISSAIRLLVFNSAEIFS